MTDAFNRIDLMASFSQCLNNESISGGWESIGMRKNNTAHVRLSEKLLRRSYAACGYATDQASVF
jgi:hypothetical protein